jgi:hypothetical protein
LSQNAQIERFVRETLGCGCEDRVFEWMEVAAEVRAQARAGARLAIGGRLLIRVLPQLTPDEASRHVGEWTATGAAERDRAGFNRFRLVLGGADPQGLEAAARAGFEAAAAGDAKLHLHVLGDAALAPVLAAVGDS